MKPARNALKGYVYQHLIFTFFVCYMDTTRCIKKIEAEPSTDKQIDDIFVESKDQTVYKIQAKNYKEVSLGDIEVTDKHIIVKGNYNSFNPIDNNVLILNNCKITPNTSLFGVPALRYKGITIISLSDEQVKDYIDNMFSTEARVIQILNLANKAITAATFEVSINDLPELLFFSTDLEDETILIRNASIPNGITLVEGLPGVGKSHFVNELTEKNRNAIVYRFWISSQDPRISMRRQYNAFLTDLGYKAFGSSRSFSEEELINSINIQDRIVIIDGLDHVENYNPGELDLFISFIDKLNNCKVIVLSRPLKKDITGWNRVNLDNWTFDETSTYLFAAYEISDYHVQRTIYDISKGYPIITYFVAEEYKVSGSLSTDIQFQSIDDYYDSLCDDNESYALLSVFACANTFFTINELRSFYSDPEMFIALQSFMNRHPYLFRTTLNRVSLLHDSFNTYLRNRISVIYAEREAKLLSIVKHSLRDGSVEYMSRLAAFSIEKSFYGEITRLYSSINMFLKVLRGTRDYDSIRVFYRFLRTKIEENHIELSIYQYYSFCMVYQMINRNDLIGEDKLIFQVLTYWDNHGDVKNELFSSEYIWSVYTRIKGNSSAAKIFLNNLHFGESQVNELESVLAEESTFYKLQRKPLSMENVYTELRDNHDYYENERLLTDYFINMWINHCINDQCYDLFSKYLNGEDYVQYDLSYIFNKDHSFVLYCLNKAEKSLNELGCFGNNNRYRLSIKEATVTAAGMGSFAATSSVASIIKLANYENRVIDIENLFYSVIMYYEHKDESAYNLHRALIAFEKHGCILQEESTRIIASFIERSDGSAKHLLSSYINEKGRQFAKMLIENKTFQSNIRYLNIFSLDTEIINVIDDETINTIIGKIIRTCRYSKMVEGNDVERIVLSVHSNKLLNEIRKHDYRIISASDKIIPILESQNIEYEPVVDLLYANKKTAERTPFSSGYITRDDFDYIKNNTDITFMDVAKYTDGWGSCFPFIDVYELFSIDTIRDHYLEIVHESLFHKLDYYNWYLVLGNIPAFLDHYDIQVDWERLYTAFIDFIDLSLILFKNE